VLALLLLAIGAVLWLFHSSVVSVAVIQGDVLTITAPAEVTVEDVFVEPGQRCDKGRPLVKLAATNVRAERSVLEAQLDRARLRFRLVEHGAELDDLRPDTRLDERDRLKAEVQAADAALTAARARYDLAQCDHAIYAELQATGRGSTRELDIAETEMIAAKAEVDRAAANLVSLRDRLKRHQELVPTNARGDELRRMELALLEKGVREAERRLDQFDYESGTRTVFAPFQGRIDRIYVKPGSHRKEGTPLLDMYDPISLHAVAYVRPADREHFQIGTDIRMYPLGTKKPVAGKVSNVYQGWTRVPDWLSDECQDRQQVAIAVRIECDPAQRHLLAPNMVVKVLSKRR
jgi:multidrug resistance efflux pump